MAGWLVIDRLERQIAVCEAEDRSMIQIPLEQLPPGVREGDCLRETYEGYMVDLQETSRRREQNRALQARLFGKDSKRAEE